MVQLAKVIEYSTYSEFIDSLFTRKDLDTAFGRHNDGGLGPAWFGNMTFDQARDMARSGNESMVDEANKLLDKLDAVTEGVPLRQWQPSVTGAYPSIGDYVVGRPDCMRLIAPTQDVSPIKIYVGIATSAALSGDDVLKRGVTLLALVLKLQQIRPVTLTLLNENGDYKPGKDFLQVIPVDSNPLSIAHAAFALAHPAFARRLAYATAHIDGIPAALPWPAVRSQLGAKYIDWIRESVGGSMQDLIIPGGHSDDALISNPIAWINEQVSRYNRQD